MVLHRTRQTLIRQRTQLSNVIRGHMAEFGIVAPIGREGLQSLIGKLADDERVPTAARGCLLMLAEQLRLVNVQVLEADRAIMAAVRSNETARRLMGIPGVGPLLASALVAAVPDPHAFRSGRNLAAWIGLVPATELQRRQGAAGRDHQGGRPIPPPDAGRRRHGGDPLRRAHGTRRPWLVQLMARRTTKVAAVALANKTARTLWAIMTSGEPYREPAAA
jgi:transposase